VFAQQSLEPKLSRNVSLIGLSIVDKPTEDFFRVQYVSFNYSSPCFTHKGKLFNERINVWNFLPDNVVLVISLDS